MKARFDERGGAQSLRDLYLWLEREFPHAWAEVGMLDRQRSVNGPAGDLFGCHDHGWVFSGVARHLSYLIIMVDAAGLLWARHSERASVCLGRVFDEVCVAQMDSYGFTCGGLPSMRRGVATSQTSYCLRRGTPEVLTGNSALNGVPLSRATESLQESVSKFAGALTFISPIRYLE